MDHLSFFLSFFHSTFLLFNRQREVSKQTVAPLNLLFSLTRSTSWHPAAIRIEKNEGFIERMNSRSVDKANMYAWGLLLLFLCELA